MRSRTFGLAIIAGPKGMRLLDCLPCAFYASYQITPCRRRRVCVKCICGGPWPWGGAGAGEKLIGNEMYVAIYDEFQPVSVTQMAPH